MNRSIFVTGATSGFGKAIATMFAEKGFDVIISGRRQDRLNDLKQSLEAQFQAKVIAFCFDVRDRKATEEAIAALKQQVDKIDILVNNAGLAAGMATIDEGDVDNWDRMIDTNIKGLLYVTRQIAPMMREQCSGHIFNIGSTAGKIAYKNGNVYCATKFAVDALSQSMRIDLLPYGIKVTAIHPGMAETEFSIVRFAGDEQKAAAIYQDVHPLQAKDIADAVFYCANLPAHVCINDLTITCLTQANGVYSIKESERQKP
jgi:3-hydroxy acid dehydrogenase/malonic semialdehyde reductase